MFEIEFYEMIAFRIKILSMWLTAIIKISNKSYKRFKNRISF